MRAGRAGQQPTDPAKAARLIVRLSEMDEPPLRLLLGPDAVRYAGAADEARIASDAKWRELSESVAFDAHPGVSPRPAIVSRS